MKLEGNYTINAPRLLVWTLLIDPDVLSRCVPGVESLVAEGDGLYRMTMKTGIGSIKGLYNGTIHLADMQEPAHYQMTVDGKGAPGFVKGKGTLDLTEDGDNTVISYAGDVSIGGTIASVGQRMIVTAAKMMTTQFFTALAAEAAAIIKAEESGEPVQTPKQGLFRNVFRATKGALKRRLND